MRKKRGFCGNFARHDAGSALHTLLGEGCEVTAALCVLMIAVMLRVPEATARAARDALGVWGLDVAPSLFPYMVLCRLVAARMKRSGLPAAPAAAALGLLGGSPSGAAVIAVYAGGLSRGQVMRLAALTGTISPMFLLNTVNAWVRDARLCRWLLLAHVCGAALALGAACLFVRDGAPACPASLDTAAEDPIAQSVQSILGVGGCIVFFSVVAAGVGAMLPGLSETMLALVHAALEVAGGVHALARAPLSPAVRAVAIAAASGFSGLSILTQNALFLRPLGVSWGALLGFGLLRALGAGAAMALFLSVGL